MFDDFLYNFYRSIKLDKSLYKDPKSFENLSFFFAGLIIIINGLAGLVAQSTFIETLRTVYGVSGVPEASLLGTVFSSILGWIIWTVLLYVIGAKLFSETNTVANFKNILIVVGYGHAPGIFRFFAVIPDLLIPIILITQLWIIASITIGINEILYFRNNFKSFGVVLASLLIIFLTFIYITRGGLIFTPIS